VSAQSDVKGPSSVAELSEGETPYFPFRAWRRLQGPTEVQANQILLTRFRYDNIRYRINRRERVRMLSVVPLRPVYMYVYDDCMSHRVTAIHTGQGLVNCPKVVPNEPEFSQ